MYYDKWWKNHNHDLEDEDQALLAGCPRKSQTIDQVKSFEPKALNQSHINHFIFFQKAMANALGVVNIGGIFVVLLCGLAFAGHYWILYFDLL